MLSRPQIATFNWIPSARRALLFANRALLSNLYFHFVLLHDTRNMLLNVLLHYERNAILLGKGFNIAVCRTVDGEVVATVKIFFVINTG